MDLMNKGSLLAIVATASFAFLAGVPLSGAAEDDRRLELATRIAELQRTRDFRQAEWDSIMRMSREAMSGQEGFEFPEQYLEVMRQIQVDGQTDAWIEALADSMGERRLQEIIAHLEHGDSQAWIADQLATYPEYLQGAMGKMESMGAQLVELERETEADRPPQPTLSEVTVVADSPLSDVLGVTPGGWVGAAIEGRYYQTVRLPVEHGALKGVFNDLEVRLVPDGSDGARVVRVSGVRGYGRASECETAQVALEQALAPYFSHWEATDCGGVRYASVDGETRMTLHCEDQQALGGSRLRLNVGHEPTRLAAEAAVRSYFAYEDTAAGTVNDAETR